MLDAIKWMKASWDDLPINMAGDELLDGLSFDDFVTFDDNLSTNVTIEGDWEQTIMDKLKE